MACMSSWTGSVMILFRSLFRCGLHSRGALQPAQTLLEHAAALEPRDHAPPGVCLFGGKSAGVYAGARDRVAHRRSARDHHVVGDTDVPGESDHPTDHAALADAGAAGDPGARGDRRVRADAHVVSDLDEVVELHAVLDDRVLDGA